MRKSDAFGITFIKAPRKRERAFVELCEPISKTDADTCRNAFRHFCQGRTAEQAVEAMRVYYAAYPHLAFMDYPGKLKKALGI